MKITLKLFLKQATDPKGMAAENGLSENWSHAEELSKMIVSLLGDPNLSADAVYDTLTKWIGNPWEGTEYEQYSREFDRWYADSKGPYFGSFSNSKRKDRYQPNWGGYTLVFGYRASSGLEAL